MDGWIKLHRKLLDNAIWKDCNDAQKVVMITLLLLANHKSNKWIFEGEKYEVQAGEFMTSIASLVKITGCTRRQVRTSLDKLEKYGFITQKASNKNRIIKINHWIEYQLKDDESYPQVINKLSTSYPQNTLDDTKNDKKANPKVEFNHTVTTQNEKKRPQVDHKLTQVKSSNINSYSVSENTYRPQVDHTLTTYRPHVDHTRAPNKNERKKECKNNIKERSEKKEVYSKINFRLLKKYEEPSHAQSKLIDSWLKDISLESLVKVIDYCTLAFRYPSYKNLNVLCEEIKTKYGLSDSGVQRFIESKNKASPSFTAKPKNGQNFKQTTYQEMTKDDGNSMMKRSNPALKVNVKDLREE